MNPMTIETMYVIELQRQRLTNLMNGSLPENPKEAMWFLLGQFLSSLDRISETVKEWEPKCERDIYAAIVDITESHKDCFTNDALLNIRAYCIHQLDSDVSDDQTPVSE